MRAEIDVLTGDARVLRADIVMDLGNSLNPSLDVGQIEGAFAQGIGLSLLEEVVVGGGEHAWINPPGRVFTSGPGTYKIPSANDVPINLNVDLLSISGDVRTVHSSRAVGEPPLFLGCSSLFAVREAIASARKEEGIDSNA